MSNDHLENITSDRTCHDFTKILLGFHRQTADAKVFFQLIANKNDAYLLRQMMQQ